MIIGYLDPLGKGLRGVRPLRTVEISLEVESSAAQKPKPSVGRGDPTTARTGEGLRPEGPSPCFVRVSNSRKQPQLKR